VLRSILAGQPDITLAELQAELRQRYGVTACLATIHVTLRRLGLRYKKRMARPVCKRHLHLV
jgi:transposase